MAFAAGVGDGDIYLVREGSPARRILGSDNDIVDQVCPAFSPDGARLASGQATDGSSGVLEKAALVITGLSADGEPSDTSTVALDDLIGPPCAIWSADGRWLAFGAETRGASLGQVWLVDTETNDVRRLTSISATDLEWAPKTSELFITNYNGITVYSTATDTSRLLDDTFGAMALAVSPDGQSLAVEHHQSGNGPVDLLLMDAGGSDQRLLVSDYRVGFGIGPVWSPDGNRVAFQRLCDTYVDGSGKDQTCLDEHEVVVVTVNDHDPIRPAGTQTVVAPPSLTHRGEARQWFPYSVSWSPDSLTLLYVAWSNSQTRNSSQGILAVPVDSATPPVILDEAVDVAGHGGEPRNTFQSWSRQP